MFGRGRFTTRHGRQKERQGKVSHRKSAFKRSREKRKGHRRVVGGAVTDRSCAYKITAQPWKNGVSGLKTKTGVLSRESKTRACMTGKWKERLSQRLGHWNTFLGKLERTKQRNESTHKGRSEEGGLKMEFGKNSPTRLAQRQAESKGS